MLPWLLGTLLGAAVPTAASAGTAADAEVTVRAAAADADWIVLGGGAPLPSTVAVSRLGAVRFDADEPPRITARGDAYTWELLPVVAHDETRARVRFDRGDVALLLWIDLADVAPQLQRPVVLGRAPGRPPAAGDGAVELAPGVALRVVERRGAWSKVALRGADRVDWIAQAEGWIDSDALGPLRTEAPFVAPDASAASDAGLRVHRRAHVRGRGTDVLATLPIPASPAGAMRLRVLARDGDVASVEAIHLCQRFVRVRGYGDSRSIVAAISRHGGFGCAKAPRIRVGAAEPAAPHPTSQVRAHEGVELLDEHARVRGRVLRTVDLRTDGAITPPGTPTPVIVDTPWGPLRLWANLRKPTARPAAAAHDPDAAAPGHAPPRDRF